ncbi:glycosyltransferase family 61 protein [Zoogloea sp.]|uniref:glycosyltransferase family 61 protein n=1 Tax=Zoogloea sp. TaxID=49181 RepID=UPI0026378F25|nr:glycosyltransferase family 61 protein [uncultured Zoogloea sp.]
MPDVQKLPVKALDERTLQDLGGRLRDLRRTVESETEALGVVLSSLAKAQQTEQVSRLKDARRAEMRARRQEAKARARTRHERLAGWKLVCDIYDDVQLPCRRLEALSPPLARRFVSELLESRAFDERLALAATLERDFLDTLCEGRQALGEYAVKLLDRKAWEAVAALVRYVEVLGPAVDIGRLSAHLETTFTLNVDAWQPDSAESLVAEADESLIEHVEAPSAHGVGLLGELRRSWLGRLYVERLKRYRAVRSGVIWLWQNGYPFYVNRVAPVVFRREAERWRPLVSVADYALRPEAGQRHVLAEPTHLETPVPVAFPEKSRAVLVSPHESYVFPEIFVTTVRNASIYGGTNLVCVGGEVIHHNLYDFVRDYTSEELHGRTAIDPKRRRVRWLLRDSEPVRVESAAVFVDACAPNYAHWLTEVLPRVVLFCREERYADIPLVVNDGLHRNLVESLRMITRGTRRIIMLPIGRAIVASELFLTSVAGYVPFERRNTRLSGHSHGVFSPAAFAEMRRCLVEAANAMPSPDWPRKIYLRRNSGVRKVINSAEIERALVARGYAVIEPEKLSFTQQVQLFSRAEAVVASTGAAVANIIFCPPGTRISIFISRFADTSYWYWQNIAAASGNVVRYVLGEVERGSTHGIHADFHVNVEDVLKSL